MSTLIQRDNDGKVIAIWSGPDIKLSEGWELAPVEGLKLGDKVNQDNTIDKTHRIKGDSPVTLDTVLAKLEELEILIKAIPTE